MNSSICTLLSIIVLLEFAVVLYLSTALTKASTLADKYRELWQEAIEQPPAKGLVEQNRVAAWEQRRG